MSFTEYAEGNFTIEVPPTTIRPPEILTKHIDTSDTQPSYNEENDNTQQYQEPGVPGRRPPKSRGPKGRQPHPDDIRGNIDLVKDIEVAHESSDNVVYAENEMSESVREVMESNYDDKTTERSDVNLYRKKNNRLDQRKIGIIIGVLLALILMLFAVSIFVIILHRRRKLNNNHQAMKIVQTHNGTLDLSDLHNGTMNVKLPNSQVYNYVTDSPASTAKDTYDLLTQRKLPDLPTAPTICKIYVTCFIMLYPVYIIVY